MTKQAEHDDVPQATPGRCPVLHGFDPLDPAHVVDPGPWTARARSESPVFFMPNYGLWCVTRYEDVLAVFSDPITYSNAESHDIGVPMPAEIADEVGHDWEWPRAGRVSVADPPEHTRLRKLLQPAFSPKRIDRWEGPIRELADGLLDRVVERGRMDLVSEYTSPIPAKVIALLLGIDPDAPEVGRFQEWGDSYAQVQIHGDMPDDEARRHWRNLITWHRFIADFVDHNRREPGDNMTTDWMNATSDEGEPKLSDIELPATIIGIQGAGSDTTANLITETVYFLQRDRQLWNAIVSDPSLIPRAIEETMRFRSPVRGLVRTVKRDVRIGDVDIPEGAQIFLDLASANFDEEVFQDAQVFDIRRPNAKSHLGFGLRAHFCIGAGLARLEARVALERLVDRLPGLRLARPSEELHFTRSLIVPGIHSLDVVWS